MSAGPRLSPAVLAARETLAAGRDKLRRQHNAGSPGVQVCNHWTDLLEGVVGELFQDALSELDAQARKLVEPGLAVVAHSGFGRREILARGSLVKDRELLGLSQDGLRLREVGLCGALHGPNAEPGEDRHLHGHRDGGVGAEIAWRRDEPL